MKSWKTSRLFGAHIAIVGCGDVGQRMIQQLLARVKIVALSRHNTIVNGARCVYMDLDDRKSLSRSLRLAQKVIYLAPPPASGVDDSRMKHFLAAAQGVQQCIYVSTTGVYGSSSGAWVTETSPLKPTELRGVRRIAAEGRLKRSSVPKISILRAPGIYAAERLPKERIEKRLPALLAADDVPTNHIHADDLARLCWLGLFKARNRRSYNVADGQPMMHADYLQAVAAHFDLPAPERLPKEEVIQALSPVAWSMLSGARRVSSKRLLNEWPVKLMYPNVLSLLSESHPAA
jgi:nucleoside-diphosphate-sugar epimerase